MFDHDALYRALDSHFTGHLVRNNEDRVSEDAETPLPDMPDVMLDDLIDELDGTLEEVHEDFKQVPNAAVAVSYGFADGVLAQADSSYTTFEDSYVADMRNADYAEIDQAIDAFAAEFEGNRDWSEAAKGYVRSLTQGDDPSHDLSDAIWRAQAVGFIYGADTSQDYEWKVMQDPAGNIIVTDEEAIEEYSRRQLSANGISGLFGKISDMMGIDLGELEAALEEAAGDEDEEDAADGEAVEAADVEAVAADDAADDTADVDPEVTR